MSSIISNLEKIETAVTLEENNNLKSDFGVYVEAFKKILTTQQTTTLTSINPERIESLNKRIKALINREKIEGNKGPELDPPSYLSTCLEALKGPVAAYLATAAAVLKSSGSYLGTTATALKSGATTAIKEGVLTYKKQLAIGAGVVALAAIARTYTPAIIHSTVSNYATPYNLACSFVALSGISYFTPTSSEFPLIKFFFTSKKELTIRQKAVLFIALGAIARTYSPSAFQSKKSLFAITSFVYYITPMVPSFPLINYLRSSKKVLTTLEKIAELAKKESESTLTKLFLIKRFIKEVGIDKHNLKYLKPLLQKMYEDLSQHTNTVTNIQKPINNIQNPELLHRAVDEWRSIFQAIANFNKYDDNTEDCKKMQNFQIKLKLPDWIKGAPEKNRILDDAVNYSNAYAAKNEDLLNEELYLNPGDKSFLFGKPTDFSKRGSNRESEAEIQARAGKVLRERARMLQTLISALKSEDQKVIRRLVALKKLANDVLPSIEKYEVAKKSTLARVLKELGNFTLPKLFGYESLPYSSLPALNKNANKAQLELERIFAQVYRSINSIVLDDDLKADANTVFYPMQLAYENYIKFASEKKLKTLKDTIAKPLNLVAVAAAAAAAPVGVFAQAAAAPVRVFAQAAAALGRATPQAEELDADEEGENYYDVREDIAVVPEPLGPGYDNFG